MVLFEDPERTSVVDNIDIYMMNCDRGVTGV